MPHMLAQEHMSIVDAMRYGTTRDQTTLNAALSAIGSTPSVLVLTFAGDGVWTVTSNTTIPTNVLLRIPMGVTVNVGTGVTLGVNQVHADQSTWKTGPGTLIASAGVTPTSITNLHTIAYQQQNSIGGTIWLANGGTGDPASIRMFINQGATCGLTLSRNDGVNTVSWSMWVNNNGDWNLIRPGAGAPMLFVNNNGLMIGANVAPTVWLLQVATNQVAMPGGGPWLNTASDARVKTVLGNYTDGLAMLKQFQAVTYEYNGKANTPAGSRHIGLIADAVEPVAPYMVGSVEAYLEPDDAQPVALKTLDTNALSYALINAVVELDSRLAVLEGQESPLVSRVTGLEGVAHGHGPSGNAGGTTPYTPPATQEAA